MNKNAKSNNLLCQAIGKWDTKNIELFWIVPQKQRSSKEKNTRELRPYPFPLVSDMWVVTVLMTSHRYSSTAIYRMRNA